MAGRGNAGRRDEIDGHPRLVREAKTIRAMIALYCRDLHAAGPGLCQECEELLGYARARLGRCRYQENKPTCARCPIHCYRPDMRARMRTVMRHAGPRMLWRHPVLAILHLLDGWKKVPQDGEAYG